VNPDGVLVVDKPGGLTSHDVVAQARRIFGTREVGHAGTLDPMATGVLLLLFGEATKLSNFLTDDNKRYQATVSFGRATDTLDADGKIIEESEVDAEALSDAAIAAALAGERARTHQLPPAVSAIKVGGRRAYAIARSGEAPELAEREVRVSELELVAREASSLKVELCVSKGYYVRALARDLGSALGVPAHLSALRRTASGSFGLAQACAWPASAEASLLPTPQAARLALSSAVLTETGIRRARHGQALELADFSDRPPSSGSATEAWLSADGILVALGREHEPGRFRVVRGFAQRGG
jgi:tRNA pseudouridine55 synthase